MTSALAGFASHLPLQRYGSAICRGFLALDLLILLLPLVYVLLVSFQPLRLLALPTNGFSLTWYHSVLNKTEWYEAALNSLAIASLTTVLAFAAGLFMAGRARYQVGAVRAVITAVALGPMALPTIVLALGIYAVFIRLGWTGNIAALAVAHTIVAVPYVFINMANGLAGYDNALDQAASSLGARQWTSFWRVKVPVLRTSIITACVLAFLISFDELVITLFLAGPALPTLPVRMWAATSQNISPELAVVGTLLTGLVVLAFAVIRLLERRRAVSAQIPQAIPEMR
jgi:ABC-type spermidine/putrescine transport system permease subunit II